MTLSYRQERLLRRTDHALCQSDPELASMLSIFARIAAPEGLPDWEQLGPKPAWGWNILLWPVAGAVFLVVFVAGGGSRAATACGAAASRRLQRLCVGLLGRERYLTRRDSGR